MKKITLTYAILDKTVTGYLMGDNVGMHYDSKLWLSTVTPTADPTIYNVVDYIALTRRPVDLMELFVMLRDMSAITFITDYLFRELAEMEMFPSDEG